MLTFLISSVLSIQCLSFTDSTGRTWTTAIIEGLSSNNGGSFQWTSFLRRRIIRWTQSKTTDRVVDTEMWHFQFNSFIISKPYRWYKRYKTYEHTVYIQMLLLMSQYKQSGWPELTYFACGEQIYENTVFFFLKRSWYRHRITDYGWT